MSETLFLAELNTTIQAITIHNLMEWNNNTRPDLNDTDGDSVTYITQLSGGLVVSHQIDYNLSDGREVFKYGINPTDDTDGDMLPDWYEYKWGGMNQMITFHPTYK